MIPLREPVRLLVIMRVIVLVLLVGSVVVATGSGCRLTNPLRPLTESFRQSGEQSRAGHTAMERDDWVAAERYFADAIRLDYANPTVRLHYGETLWNVGKRAESLKELHEASRLSKGRDAAIQSALAAKLLETGQLETALQCAETATHLAPNDARGWLLLGRVCVTIGDKFQSYGRPDEAQRWLLRARDSYHRATSLATDRRSILPELATLQMKLHQPEYALASWQTLQDTYLAGTEPAFIFVAQGDVLASMDRLYDAVDCYELALDRGADGPELPHKIAQLETRLGRFDCAERWMRVAIDRAPDDQMFQDFYQHLRVAARP